MGGGRSEVDLQSGGRGKFSGQVAGDLAPLERMEKGVVDVPETAVAGVAIQLGRHGGEEGAALGVDAGPRDEVEGCSLQGIGARRPAPVAGSGGGSWADFLLPHEGEETAHVGGGADKNEASTLALDLDVDRGVRRKALDAVAEFIRGAHPERRDGDEAISRQEAGAFGRTVKEHSGDGHRIGSCGEGPDPDGAVAAGKIGGQLPIRGRSCCGRRGRQEQEEKGDRCHIAF